MSDNIHRPVLIIIAGPNGSGKTTITSQILHHEWLENSVYINPDQVAQERFADGAIIKRYTDDIPQWAKSLVL